MSEPTISPLAAHDADSPVVSTLASAAPVELVPAPLSAGQQLVAARVAKGLSINAVAAALKLSPYQVEALETDDWARLSGKTMIRGFVRNYARLLELDSKVLMASLDAAKMPAGPELTMSSGTKVSIPRAGGVERRDYVRIFSGLLLLALAVAAYFFSPPDLWQQVLSAVKTLAQPNAAVVSEGAPLPGDVKAFEAAPMIAEPPLVLDAETPAAAPLAEPQTSVPAIAANRLSFRFARSAWVEVRDRSGDIVFSEISPAASQREVEGQPPFAVVVGNAAHVTLHYKGKPVDLSRRSRDDVARVTVE